MRAALHTIAPLADQAVSTFPFRVAASSLFQKCQKSESTRDEIPLGCNSFPRAPQERRYRFTIPEESRAKAAKLAKKTNNFPNIYSLCAAYGSGATLGAKPTPCVI
jgi:hypothetical protein